MRLEGDDYMTIEQCYLLSRVFMALAILLAVIMVIYGYNNKIILKIQKFYGIEKKREVRKMINSHYASNVKYKGNDNLVTPAGMEGMNTNKLSNNKCIGDVIDLLEEVAGNHWQGK